MGSAAGKASVCRVQGGLKWRMPLPRRVCGDAVADGQSSAQVPPVQVAAGLAGFFGFFALALTGFFAAVAGLMLIGLPAGAATASLGSGRKCARQPGERRDLLRIMQAVTRSTSGISGPQN
jgi:hypothetical protein